ncbi:MAG: DMT family transporter [Desulfobacterales bacterium]|nr:DMT family transporter [Desulfobacterales bacterium]
MKLGYTGIGPFTSAGIRFTLASILLILWARYKSIPLKLTPTQWRLILFQCFLFIFQVSCFHLGLANTTASHGALIANILPFMVLILAHFFIPGDRITIRKGLGILLGFIGVVILFFDAPDLNTDLQKGDIIVLTAVLCWSVSAIYVKRIIDHFDPVQITLYPMVLGIPVFFINGWLWDEIMIYQITPTVIKALLYQGAIIATFGFVCWNTMLRKFGATALHSFVFIVPLSGVTNGVIILDEPVTSHLLMAITFIVIGIVVVNFKRRKKTPAVPLH